MVIHEFLQILNFPMNSKNTKDDFTVQIQAASAPIQISLLSENL